MGESLRVSAVYDTNCASSSGLACICLADLSPSWHCFLRALTAGDSPKDGKVDSAFSYAWILVPQEDNAYSDSCELSQCATGIFCLRVLLCRDVPMPYNRWDPD